LESQISQAKCLIAIRVPIPLRVATPDKVREMAELGGALSNLESRQMLEYGIESGRGGVTLEANG